jgi:uncharacterized membrane-anchored protein
VECFGAYISVPVLALNINAVKCILWPFKLISFISMYIYFLKIKAEVGKRRGLWRVLLVVASCNSVLCFVFFLRRMHKSSNQKIRAMFLSAPLAPPSLL